MSKPANTALKDRGVTLRPLNLEAGHDALVAALTGIQVFISAIGPMPPDQLAQIPLATAAKAAGVKRFLPCAAIPVIAPGGIHMIRDVKEQVYNHIKQICLPYTIVDVGWWYQIAHPPLPSGRTDYVLGIHGSRLAGDGNVPSALTDLGDVGRYFAKIVVDERTVNKYVLVYDEMWTQNQIYDLMERLSGEKIPRHYDSLTTLQAMVSAANAKLAKDPTSIDAYIQKIGAQYQISWGIRGDNTPEYAKYLGYVTSRELYPEFEHVKFEAFVRELLEGKGQGVYKERQEALFEMFARINEARGGMKLAKDDAASGST